MSPQFGRRRLLDPRGQVASYEHAQRRARIVARIVVGFFAIVVGLAATGIAMGKNILDKRHHGPAISKYLPASERPTPQSDTGAGSGKAQNILILGVDSRLGENSSFQPTTGPAQTETLSDTAILAHLSGDHKHVTLVSIPRDSVVDIPSCQKFDANGKPVLDSSGNPVMTKETTALFNEAIQRGGPVCTAKTLEKLTNVRIDNYLEIDFEGIIKMSNAIGGVPLTMCKPIHDVHTGLNLPAGPVNLKGQTALAFVRARYGLTGGDDLHRIQRQQQFMAAMVRKALSETNFFNILELNSFYGAVAGSLTTDLTSSQLLNLALRYRHIDTSNIVFATVPTYPAPKDSKWNQHLFWSDEATTLFDAIRADRPLTASSANGHQVAAVSVAPSEVSVRVLNGTTTNNLAHDVADELASKGFRIAGIGTASGIADKTTVTYSASRTNSAKTLAAALSVVPQEQEVSSAGTVVTLTIGKDWNGLATPAPPASPSPSASAPAASGSPAPSTVPGAKATNASTDSCVEG